jgi:hypothetical protein
MKRMQRVNPWFVGSSFVIGIALLSMHGGCASWTGARADGDGLVALDVGPWTRPGRVRVGGGAAPLRRGADADVCVQP